MEICRFHIVIFIKFYSIHHSDECNDRISHSSVDFFSIFKVTVTLHLVFYTVLFLFLTNTSKTLDIWVCFPMHSGQRNNRSGLQCFVKDSVHLMWRNILSAGHYQWSSSYIIQSLCGLMLLKESGTKKRQYII